MIRGAPALPVLDVPGSRLGIAGLSLWYEHLF